MVLAQYPQNTLYHRIYKVHFWIWRIMLEPRLLQPCFHVAGLINRIAIITTRIAIITTINRIAMITTINRIAIITFRMSVQLASFQTWPPRAQNWSYSLQFLKINKFIASSIHNNNNNNNSIQVCSIIIVIVFITFDFWAWGLSLRPLRPVRLPSYKLKHT